jgi:hypothetical protein
VPNVVLGIPNIALIATSIKAIEFLPEVQLISFLEILDGGLPWRLSLSATGVRINDRILDHVLVESFAVNVTSIDMSLDYQDGFTFPNIHFNFLVDDVTCSLNGLWPVWMASKVSIRHGTRPIYFGTSSELPGFAFDDSVFGIYYLPWRPSYRDRYCICHSFLGTECRTNGFCLGFAASEILPFTNAWREFSLTTFSTLQIGVVGSTSETKFMF